MRQKFSRQRFLGLLVIVQFVLIAGYFLIMPQTTVGYRLGRVKSLFGASQDTGQQWLTSNNGSVGTIIAAAQNSRDLSWIEGVREQSWTPLVYDVDAPYEGENTPTVMRNKGHEAMVYLTYMIDNYSNLPPYAMFIHGHLESWHQQSDIPSIIRKVRLPAVDKAGYVSLRCDWYPSCPAELRPVGHDAHGWGPGVHRQDAEDGISCGAWQTLFPNTPMPETIASQCCAQFVVTRAAMQRNKRKDYIRMRQWILDTELVDDVSGRVLEKLWAYIMTGRAVNCPSPQFCSCEFFGKCDKQKWAEPPAELGPLPEDSRWVEEAPDGGRDG